MQNYNSKFKSLQSILSQVFMKKIFLVIPVGLISLAAVAVGVFFQPKNLSSNSASINDGIASSSPTCMWGTSRNDIPEEKPEIVFPRLDQPQITAGDLKTFEVDSDQDGLTDFLENFYRTDPRKTDSDGDGYKDGEEVEKGYNPNGEGQL